MSSQKVHGITIELDVNTSGVSESFKGINRSLNSTSSELKTINKSLKENGNSTVLLSQKQQLLSDAIQKTSDKLKLLKIAKESADKAGSGVDKQSKEYRELERDIIDTTNALKELQKQQKQNATDTIKANVGINDLSNKMKEGKEATDLFFNAVATGVAVNLIAGFVKEAVSAISQLTSTLNEWADGYREESVYEKQFENNIRNTADATEEEIDALKKLAAQKSKQGVISKKAITSGYQELATYVESTDAIEGLTDALVDMAAQQYGVDATEESVRNIATTLGKALANGDYSGLTRLGYGFDEAQQRVMKYGDELERVEVLNEVIGSSIGGMNEALAETDAGKIFQVSQYFDEAKGHVGELVSEIETTFLDGVMPDLQEFIDGALQWLDDHKDEIMEMVTNVVEWLTSEDTKEFFTSVFDLIGNLISVGEQLVGILDDLGLIKGAIDLVKGAVDLLNGALNIAVGLIQKIRDFWNDSSNFENGAWMNGQYVSFGSAGSGGFGIDSGGFAGGGIVFNASFTINNANNIGTRELASRMAYQMLDVIDIELGKRW